MNKWEIINALGAEDLEERKRGRRSDSVLEMLEQANAPNTQELTDEAANQYYMRHKAAKRKENPQ